MLSAYVYVGGDPINHIVTLSKYNLSAPVMISQKLSMKKRLNT